MLHRLSFFSAFGLVLCIAATGCEVPPSAAPAANPPTTPPISSSIPASVVADATAGVEDPKLRDLLARDWDFGMHESPVTATALGDHRFDDRISDPSYDHVQKVRAVARTLLDEAQALPVATLSLRDREILELYIDQGSAQVATNVCEFELWNVGPGGADPFESLTPVAEKHSVKTVADGKNLVARYRAMPAYLDAITANVRRGVKEGRVATAALLHSGIDETDITIALPFDKWELAKPAQADHADWTHADLASFRGDVMAALPPIRAALVRYRDALKKDVLPHGRDEAHAGLVGLPNGLACYQAMIQLSTSLPMTADELHKLGLEEVKRAEQEFADLGQQIYSTRDLTVINDRLRNGKDLYFATSADIQTLAEQTIARTRAKLPQYFGTLPKAELIVRGMDPAEAATHAAPFYEEANTDGSKPGEYRINLSKPETRSRWDAENSAFHEGLPGHHLQISIAQELQGVPAFLKYGDMTAFIEGWALYAERLADEMGLYSGPVDRLGMVEWDLVRGARLVVDTGIHALGWPPAQARQYFHDHTAMTDADIALEIDRYTSSPGQALAYKVGDITIRRLRHKAEEILGPKFDVRGFHDIVLGGGAVTLGVLERRVNDWIAAHR